MTANELRKKFLDFMEKKGHKIIPSSSLVPENDPTTLFTGSGMQPMIPYLLGEKHPLGKKIADSQKSFRTVDIEEVGDNRHTTFFEMLGNWSFGDYFKREQIEWIFEFLTKEIGLDPKRIYVSVFRGKEDIGILRDSEAVDIWKEQFKKVNIDASDVDFSEEKGMNGGRIFYYDESKNWWSRSGKTNEMPIGEPGGPDSEMFWDFGEQHKFHENSEWKNKPCHINCDCGRFLEIGNNVFMEYVKTENGFEMLKQKNVDYGGGLERQIAAVANDPDMFSTEIFSEAINKIELLSGKKYEEDKEAFRIIVDHIRAATFLIGDGVYPSNKDRGYFVRRLIRRAIRFSHKLGIKSNFCREISEIFIHDYKNAYLDLERGADKIKSEFEEEENKFRETLIEGLNEFNKYYIGLSDAIDHGRVNKNSHIIPGFISFRLYSTYGFPLELQKEIAEEKGLEINVNEFNEELKKHQELSRTASAGMFKGGLADTKEKTTELHTVAHLMVAGLRKVLGEHVHQRGANINGERVRFDFSHSEKMTDEQKKAVEDYVNEAIEKKVPVELQEMSPEEAKVSGAEGEFSHKYGNVVKVYTIEGYSKEICGGPHVKNTGEISGKFRITKEESGGSGIRRIKAALE